MTNEEIKNLIKGLTHSLEGDNLKIEKAIHAANKTMEEKKENDEYMSSQYLKLPKPKNYSDMFKSADYFTSKYKNEYDEHKKAMIKSEKRNKLSLEKQNKITLEFHRLNLELLNALGKKIDTQISAENIDQDILLKNSSVPTLSKQELKNKIKNKL